MSVRAVQLRRRWSSVTLKGPWRSHLSRRIVATNLATAGVSFLAALLVLGPAVTDPPDAVLWTRIAGAALLAAAAALALGGVMAWQVAEPLRDLRRAVDSGWARCGGRRSHGAREREPGSRSDEIGQLSGTIRRLIETLSDRIVSNENLVADIAHEVRNPLTSLRSAAEAMHRSNGEQRRRLVNIIEQDVARLDRLVGEIASSSRLDAELVRERAVEFDLLALTRSLAAHLSHTATARAVEVICDLPEAPVRIVGLEPRLAQVIVNLVENAISLCEGGDAVRVWVRRREKRVFVVVEDTGPGIPDGEAEKIFRRFYTHRPERQSGGNSGLGLAISRQIVEAHGGVIWAENIRPTARDILSEPLGARFIVVLPL